MQRSREIGFTRINRWVAVVLMVFAAQGWCDEPASDPAGKAQWITVPARDRSEFALISISIQSEDGAVEARGEHPLVEPAWSPDGQKLAYVSFEHGPGQIYVLDVKTQTTKKLTSAQDWERNPTWSPDGSKIAFTSRRDGHEQIYLMNGDGSDQRNISNSMGYDADPTWSPDGQQIAFASLRDDQPFRLFVMNADGSEQRALSDRPLTGWLFPDWSPDGRWIACGESDRGGGIALLLFHVEGGTWTDVVRNAGCNTFARWSPDGRYLAYAAFESPPPSYRPGDTVDNLLVGDLMLFDGDTSATTMLAENSVPGWGPRPSWKPAQRNE